LNLVEVSHHLSAFSELANSTARGRTGSENIPQLLKRYGGPIDLILLPRQARSLTLETLNRWMMIEFPAQAVRLTGMHGTAVKVSDLLRWTAEDMDDAPRARHYVDLAERLDESCSPRPVFGDRTPDRLAQLSQLVGVTEHVTFHPQGWCREAMQDIYRQARDLVWAIRHGDASTMTGIDFPDTVLPSEAQGITWETGWILKAVATRADYLSEGEQEALEQAVAFFPDENLEISVNRDDGSNFWVVEPSLLMQPIEDDLQEAIGSVRIVNYGPGSTFSKDADKYEFRLHLEVETDIEDGQVCFLVSDGLTYKASIGLEN
jgi:hypothetical protein